MAQTTPAATPAAAAAAAGAAATGGAASGASGGAIRAERGGRASGASGKLQGDEDRKNRPYMQLQPNFPLCSLRSQAPPSGVHNAWTEFPDAPRRISKIL